MDLDNIPTKQTVTMGGWNPPPPLEGRPMDREPTLGELGLCGVQGGTEYCDGTDFCCPSA